MKTFVIACIALAMSAAPALAERVSARPEMNDCQRNCVQTYGPKVDALSESKPAAGVAYGEHRKQTLAAIAELNNCIKACATSQSSTDGPPAWETLEAP